MPYTMWQAGETSLEEYSSIGTWTLRGLTVWPKSTTTLESFLITHQNSSKWCMVLTNQVGDGYVQNGVCLTSGLYLSLHLKSNESSSQLTAKLKVDEILPGGKKRVVFPSKSCTLAPGQQTELKLLRQSLPSANANTSSDMLTLQCEICIPCVSWRKKPADTEVLSGLQKDFGEMFNQGVLTDFELLIGESVLRAHKAVLCVRSPVFAALLQPHTKEAQDGCVAVPDLKSEAVKQMLLYMYTGTAPALRYMPRDLLVAADKYGIDSLKKQCGNELGSRLTVENAAETACFASDYTCATLLDSAATFIRQNQYAVMSSSGWMEAVSTHPEAVQKISQLIAGGPTRGGASSKAT